MPTAYRSHENVKKNDDVRGVWVAALLFLAAIASFGVVMALHAAG